MEVFSDNSDEENSKQKLNIGNADMVALKVDIPKYPRKNQETSRMNLFKNLVNDIQLNEGDLKWIIKI